ncbi:MAG TPA: DotH/IcmK family type IV secretion protein [Coxiellaceae bacterium]|nr:DotH/IcmK family type IV secretion protein [Coxiellaceae bacterium]
MVRNLMPLNPDQITTLRNMFNKTQQAVTQYPGVPPKPTSSSILVNMSPGAAPPVIRLRAGYVTSLVFLDSTGQPWPVVGYDLGNPKAFSIMPTTPNGKGDTLMLQALERYQQGNLAVMLKGENTPVMLTLMPGQRAVDYRVDLRIPGLGPNATVTMSGLPQTESPVLMDFLDGVAPSGAKLLTIHGAPAQGWIYAGHLFLRTRVTVLSPGWISSMSSPDGTNVYELTKTPIILASERGQMIQLSIKGL